MKKLILSFVLLLLCNFSFGQNPLAGSGYTYKSGTNSKIQIPAGLDTVSFPITFTAWYKSNGFSQGALFVSQENTTGYSGFSIVATTTNIQVIIGAGTGFSFNDYKTHNFQTGMFGTNIGWTHVAVVLNSINNIDVYVNGILKTGNTFGNGTTMDTDPTYTSSIGYRKIFNFDQYFDGEIDDVALYSRALLQGQIRRVMTRGAQNYQIDQLFRYQMNSVTGTTIPDGTPNSWDGTVVGTGVTFPHSGAAIGDTSIWGIPATLPFSLAWPNGSGPTVSTNSVNIEAVYIYKVYGQPNTLNGTTGNCLSDPYWGVFTSRTGFTATPPPYTVNYPGRSVGYTREDNSIDPWSPASFSGVTISSAGRAEYIYDLTIDSTGYIVTQDTVVCDSIFTIIGPPNVNGSKLLWNTGDTTSNITVNSSGTYVLEILDDCINGLDTVQVDLFYLPPFDIKDTVSCQGTPLLMEAPGAPFVIYNWSNGNTGNAQVYPDTGTFWVTAVNGLCSVTDTFRIFHMPDISVQDYAICDGNPPTITLPDISPGNYLWSDGSTGSTFVPSTSGEFWVQATLGSCVKTDTFRINLLSTTLDVLDDYILQCHGKNATFVVPDIGYPIEWSNGQTGDSAFAYNTGWLIVTYQTVCGPVSDSIFVEYEVCRDDPFFEPSSFTPNGDGLNDVYRIQGFLGSYYELRIFDRQGKQLFYTKDPNEGWDGKGAEPGVYVARFLYRDQNDKEKEKIIHITLIR